MKILILNALYPSPLRPKILGGAELSVRKIAEEFVRNGHEVEVIVPISPSSPPTIEQVEGVSVYGSPVRNIYWFMDPKPTMAWKRVLWHLVDDWFSPPHAVEERMRTFRPDILYTNNITGITPRSWKIARSLNINVVHTLRDYYLLCPKTTLFSKGKPCAKACAPCRLLTINRRRLTKYVNGVVGNSNFILNEHTRRHLFASATVRTAIGSISESPTNSLKGEPNESKRPVVFGFIGRITKEKGVFALAEAFQSLSRPAELWLAGEATPDLQAAFEQDYRDRRIRFLGFVTPKQFYSEVDVVVAPSLWHEPLPRSVVDAVAFQKPIIGSNRGGIPEAMGDPPQGWIFDPSLSGDLIDKLNLAYDFVENGNVFPKLDPPKYSVYERYSETFKEVLSGK